METIIDGTSLARTIAAERIAVRREPIVLSYPGTLLRSIANQIREYVDVLNRALNVEVNTYQYCTFNPGEC